MQIQKMVSTSSARPIRWNKILAIALGTWLGIQFVNCGMDNHPEMRTLGMQQRIGHGDKIVPDQMLNCYCTSTVIQSHILTDGRVALRTELQDQYEIGKIEIIVPLHSVAAMIMKDYQNKDVELVIRLRSK